MAAITDTETPRRIRGEGTPEQAWQAWPGLADLTKMDATELVPNGHRLVIVAPHPDDEILGAGGLMAQCQALGREVCLIAVTDGTASHPGSHRWPPDILRRERPLETLRALAWLGLADIHIDRLRLQDGQLRWQEQALAEALSHRLQPRDVVLSTWRCDGHPDHEATGRACAHVAASLHLLLLEMPIWAWHWAAPADVRLPWSHACQLALSDQLEQRKREAAQAFVSQTDTDPSNMEGCILPPTALARLLRPFEVFFR